MRRIIQLIGVLIVALMLSLPVGASTAKCSHPTQGIHNTSTTRRHQVQNWYSTGTQNEWVYYLVVVSPGTSQWKYIGVYTRSCFWT